MIELYGFSLGGARWQGTGLLKPIPGFDEIALWAAYHHESPGGDGYPFRVSAERLCLEARVLRVADIFQAMAQDRPYRAGLPAG